MRLIRFGVMTLCLLLGAVNGAVAGVNIDINLSLFPELVPVPGYPVYYAPREDMNYFFYDGQYWLYEDDDWFVSDWYNGPWEYVDHDDVPVFILRVPVRYYRRPPPYFRGWVYNEPPRWGQHWGYGWERNHHDWNHWDHRHSPAPAPLPDYQRHYSHDRYPDRSEQREIRDRSDYRYQPHDTGHGYDRQPNAREPERRDQHNRSDEHNWQEDSNRRAAPPPAGWQGAPQRNGNAAQPQQEQHNNWQRRIPVSEPRRGQQPGERNEQQPQGNERGNSSHSREPQEQRQQQPNVSLQRGQEQGREQHGDDSRQDQGHGGNR
jgi:hypothetical protein